MKNFRSPVKSAKEESIKMKSVKKNANHVLPVKKLMRLGVFHVKHALWVKKIMVKVDVKNARLVNFEITSVMNFLWCVLIVHLAIIVMLKGDQIV